MAHGGGSFDSDIRGGGVMVAAAPAISNGYTPQLWGIPAQAGDEHAGEHDKLAQTTLSKSPYQQHGGNHQQARSYTTACAPPPTTPTTPPLPPLDDLVKHRQPAPPSSGRDRQLPPQQAPAALSPPPSSKRSHARPPVLHSLVPHAPATDPGHGDIAAGRYTRAPSHTHAHARSLSHSASLSSSSHTSHSHGLRGAVPSFIAAGSGQSTPSRPSSPTTSASSRARSRPNSTSAPRARARSRSRPASPTSRRGTSPSSTCPTQLTAPTAPQPPRSRIPTPTRPRAYSASAAEAQETLSDEAPPPLPPLPRHRQYSHSHAHAHSSPPLDSSDAYAHARALESALHASSSSLTSSTTHPRQAFPHQPPTPPLTAAGMSVSSHTPAPEAPHRLVTSHSGIPVLKTRARSTQRTPSPEFPSGAERLADELPPFRVDLDAALAEIEDELEMRAQERYALAQPASPSLSASPTFPSASPGGLTPATSRLRQPKQKLRTRPSMPPGSNNGSAAATPARKFASGAAMGVKPRAGSTGSGPATPKSRLGRASSASAVSPARGVRGSTPRRRHGSDVSQSLGPGSRPRARNTSTSPGYGGTTPNGTPNGASAIPVPKRPTRSQSGSLASPSPSSVTSKLGVAAHFVPPESSFTPPKGADWDDVVLPTVAKKTGIVVAGSHGWRMADGGTAASAASHGLRYSDEDDDGGSSEEDLLAVEWDKDGTPIRWERQRRPVGLSDADFTANRAASGAMYDLYDFHAAHDYSGLPPTPASPGYAPPSSMDFGPASPTSPVTPITPGPGRPATAPTRPQRASTRRVVGDDGDGEPVSLRTSAAHPTGLDGGKGVAGVTPVQKPSPAPAPTKPHLSSTSAPTTAGAAAAAAFGRKRKSKPPTGLDNDDVTKSSCACVIM